MTEQTVIRRANSVPSVGFRLVLREVARINNNYYFPRFANRTKTSSCYKERS